MRQHIARTAVIGSLGLSLVGVVALSPQTTARASAATTAAVTYGGPVVTNDALHLGLSRNPDGSAGSFWFEITNYTRHQWKLFGPTPSRFKIQPPTYVDPGRTALMQVHYALWQSTDATAKYYFKDANGRDHLAVIHADTSARVTSTSYDWDAVADDWVPSTSYFHMAMDRDGRFWHVNAVQP